MNTKLQQLVAALRNQQQCDEDGVMCIVSRQAADEAANLIERQASVDGAPERKLTKVARIGNTTYGIGVSESLVIDRAYREQEWYLKPPMETDPTKLEKLREAIKSSPPTSASTGERG